MTSSRHAIVALTNSLLSLRWLAFCAVGRHRQFLIVEAWGCYRKCIRCGKRLS